MCFIFLFYLLLLLLNNINSSYISIPFKVQKYIHGKQSSLLSQYLYKDLLVKLKIGNPTQEIQLSACLGEFTTFVISKGAKGYEGGTYNKNLSNTYSSLFNKTTSYIFQTFSEGINSKENFLTENPTTEIKGLEFILATEIGGNNCYFTYCEVLTQPGILGFKLAHLYEIEDEVFNTNFISQLKKKKLISNYNFYFHFNSEDSGNIIIGLKPHEYDNNYIDKNKKYSFIKTSIIDQDLDWSLTFDKIYYGDEELDNEKPILLRIEYGLINGNYFWQKHLENTFFNRLIEEKKCFRNYSNEVGNTVYFYYCNKNTDLSQFKPFTFSIHEFNKNFTLTKDDLFIEDGDKYFFLMTFGGITTNILGYPFLKKYQLVFNQDTKIIGFYTDININDKNNNSNISYYVIIIILGIILLSLIIYVIIFYLKRKKNTKKNATELSNEQNEEYSNKNTKILEDEENEKN